MKGEKAQHKKDQTRQWYKELCFYETGKERKDARRYLNLWKRFLLDRLPPTLKFIEEKWIEVEEEEFKSISLKILMKRPEKMFVSKYLKIVGETPLSYDEIEYNVYDWVDAKKFLPAKFDLVEIKTEETSFNGWHTGGEWFSRKLKKKDEILFWKRIEEIY